MVGKQIKGFWHRARAIDTVYYGRITRTYKNKVAIYLLTELKMQYTTKHPSTSKKLRRIRTTILVGAKYSTKIKLPNTDY